MDGLPSCAVLDLLSAGCAVGDDEVRGAGGADGGEEGEFGHGAAGGEGFGLVAEGAGHAAAGALDHPDLEARHAGEDRLHRREGAERLLVAMPVHMRDPPALIGQRQRDAPRLEIGREHLLDEEARPPEVGGGRPEACPPSAPMGQFGMFA